MVTAKESKIVVSLDFQANGQSLGRAVRDIEKNLGALQKRSAQIGKSMASIVPAFAATGAAAFSAYKFATSAAIQFEDSFAGIKKTLNFTSTGAVSAEKKFKNLSDEIRGIAKSTPVAAAELNKIGEIGGQLGIKASQIGKFVDTISKLTVATNMGAEDAAFAISRLANITGTAEKDIDKLASTLVRLGNEFAATESEIVNTALGIATAMEALESPITNAAVDAMALATALKAVGVQSQSGATAVQRALDVMGKAVVGGGKDLAVFAKISGMTVTAFEQLATVDPARAFLKFLNGLRDISDSGGDTIVMLEQLGLSQQRTVRALRALAFASDDVERALTAANEEFVINNALQSEAEKRYETTTSQIALLRNQLQDLGIGLGLETLPVINNLVASLNTIFKAGDADSLKNLIKNFGLLAVTAGTVVAATKNIQRNLAMMTGGGKEGQGAFFADFFQGSQSSAGTNASAQIETMRAEFRQTLKDTFARQVVDIEEYARPAFEAEFERLMATAEDGNLQFLAERNLDGSGRALLPTNRDTLLQTMGAMGMETSEVDAILKAGARQGIDVLGDTTGFDMDNLTDAQKTHLTLQDQIRDSVLNQVIENKELNELVETRNQAISDAATLKNDEIELNAEIRKNELENNELLDSKRKELNKINRIINTNADKLTQMNEADAAFNEMTKKQQQEAQKVFNNAKKDQIAIDQELFDLNAKLTALEDKKAKGKLVDVNEIEKTRDQINALKQKKKINDEILKNSEKIIPTHEGEQQVLRETNKELKQKQGEIKKEIELLELRNKLLSDPDAGIAEMEAKTEMPATVRDARMEAELMSVAQGTQLGGYNEAFKNVDQLKSQFHELSEQFHASGIELMNLNKQVSEGTATLDDLRRIEILNNELKEMEPHVMNARNAYMTAEEELGELVSTGGDYVKLLKTQEVMIEQTLTEGGSKGKEKKIQKGSGEFEDVLAITDDFDLRQATKNIGDYVEVVDKDLGNVEDRISSTKKEIDGLTEATKNLNAEIDAQAADPDRRVDQEAVKKGAELEEELSNKTKLHNDLLEVRNDLLFKQERGKMKLLELETALRKVEDAAREEFRTTDDINKLSLYGDLLERETEIQAELKGLTEDEKKIRDKFMDTQGAVVQEAIEGAEKQIELNKQKSKEMQTASQNQRADLELEIEGLEKTNELTLEKVKNNEKVIKAGRAGKGGTKGEKELLADNLLMLDEVEKNENKIKDLREESKAILNETNQEILEISEQNVALEEKTKQVKDELNEREVASNSATQKKNKLLDEQAQNQETIGKIKNNQLTEEEFVTQKVEEASRKQLDNFNQQKAAREKAVATHKKEVNLIRQQVSEELAIAKAKKSNAEASEIHEKSIKRINGFIKEQVSLGNITEAQARSIVAMIDTGNIGDVVNELDEVVTVAELMSADTGGKKGFFNRFKPTPETVQGIKNIRAEIDNVGTGFFGTGNKLKGFAMDLENSGTQMGARMGKIIRAFSKGIKIFGIFGKNMDLLNTRFVANNMLTPAMIKLMTKLTMVVRGVTAAIMGLVANLGIMAAFSAVMTAFFKITENAAKTGAVIQTVRDSLDGLFADRQSLVGQKVQVTELEKLLDEYKNKGSEFDEVVTAIEERLKEANKNLISSEIEYNKQLGEIVRETLFDSKTLMNNADVDKFIMAVAQSLGSDIDLAKGFDGFGQSFSEELFLDDFFQSIGGKLADITQEGILSPRDIMESFLDVEAFDQASRDIFGAILTSFEDNSKLVYDGGSGGGRNFFERFMPELLDAVDMFDLPRQFGDTVLFGRDSEKEGYFNSKGFRNYTENVESDLKGFIKDIEVIAEDGAIRIEKTGIGSGEIATLTAETFAMFLSGLEDPALLSQAEKVAGQQLFDSLFGGLQDPENVAQFKKDFVTMMATGNVVIEQAFQDVQGANTLVRELQIQAMLAEMKQLQNEGFIGTIIDPAKDMVKARAQLQTARNQLLAEEEANAAKIREELNLAELELDKFNQTLIENFNKVRQTLSNLFQDMPTQVKKSIKRITEELMVKGALQRNFESMIQRLATFAPVLAEKLSKEGPKVAAIVRNFLNDRTMAQVAESGLINLFPEGAGELGIKADELDKLKEKGLDIGSAMADGILLGLHNRGTIDLPNSLVALLNSTVHAGVDAMGISSPSQVTRKEIGEPMIDGIVSALVDPEVMKKAMKQTLDGAIMAAQPYVEEFEKYFYATFQQSADEIKTAMDALFGFTSAQRALVAANYSVQKSEQALMATRREQASFSDRFLANQKELNRLSIEGRKGNITGSEELSILKQKVALQDMLDRSQGKRSASERLAIANAEEELEKLTLAAEAGIVSALEVEAAEEALAEMKGENLSEDEQRIAVLELSEAEKELNRTEDEAKEVSKELISARETHISLLDEQANQTYELETAYDSLEAALDNVVKAEHAYEVARDKFSEFAATSPEIFDLLSEGYGGVGSHIDSVISKTKNLATQTVTSMDTAIEKTREYLDMLARADAENLLEYDIIDGMGLSKGQKLAQAEFENINQFLTASNLQNSATSAEINRRIAKGTLGVNRAGAKGQFLDDAEMNNAAKRAMELISADDEGELGETSMRRFEFINALEGLLGVPFTLFESGQIATSKEALEAQDLLHLIPDLSSRGIQIYDTSQKLKDYEADFSREGISGTRYGGYNPMVATQGQAQPSKTFKASDLPAIFQELRSYGNKTGQTMPSTREALFTESGFSTATGAPGAAQHFMNMLNNKNNYNNLSAADKTVTDNYFMRLAKHLENYFHSLGLTNSIVVKGYKYGGMMKPFQRALVGEYGPEMVTAIPGGGLRVTPQGSERGGSINVENVNVQVTGVPSDPIQARKAAQQIQKALVNLGKEGSIGTGLRRN